MKNEKTRWFGIPKLFPYLKGYGRLVLVDMVALGFVGSAMDAVIPLFQQYAIDHFIANETLAGLGGFLALYVLVMIVQTATNCISAFARRKCTSGATSREPALTICKRCPFPTSIRTASAISTRA